jgi:hypothetical protein
VDQVEHVSSDKDRAELLEVAVVLVLDLSNTPRVLTALDDAAIASLDVLLGTNNGKGDGSHQAASMLGCGLIVLLDRGLVNLDVLGLDDRDNPLLELLEVRGAESVCLGDDGNKVNTRAQPLHNLNVEGLKSVTSGANEVQAGVDAEIDLVLTARLLLLKHVGLVLVVEELDNGHPGIAVVDVVTESRCVDNGQADLEELLLELSLGDLDFDGLVNLLLMTALVVGIVLDGGREKGVDEGRLSKAGLASNHNSEASTTLSDDLVSLVGQIGNANRRGALRSGRSHCDR